MPVKRLKASEESSLKRAVNLLGEISMCFNDPIASDAADAVQKVVLKYQDAATVPPADKTEAAKK